MTGLVASLEAALDVIGEIILSPEFSNKLGLVHEQERVKIAYRTPEYVYPEEIQTPDGYPCCELVAVTVSDQSDSTVADLLHEISCQWTVNGDDEQVMGRELKRLIEATRLTFRSITLLPYVGGSMRTGNADFGPTASARVLNTPTGRWVKSGSIELFWKAFTR